MKATLFLSLVAVVALCVVFATKYTMLKLRVAHAASEVAIFEEMKVSANLTTDPKQLSGKLEYVVNYYPSGSKQAKGTQLDRVVETTRSNAVDAILARLRIATAKDLGNDPEKWLKEYPPK